MNAKSRARRALPRGKNKNIPQEETPFQCFRCGICCTKYHVHVSFIEAHRIADELGFTWDEWLDKYIEKRWPRFDSYLLHRNENGSCVFLDRVSGSKISRCRIHPFRPSSCREWSPGLYRPECQEGLNYFWELTVSEKGIIAGTKEKLADFSSFLKLLYSSDQ